MWGQRCGWAKPQAIKAGILYYMYWIPEQPIEGPRHIWLRVSSSRSPPLSKRCSLLAHCARGNWTGNFMCDKWDGVSSQALQAKPWMSLSDLTSVSQNREWELQRHLDNRCEMQSTLVYHICTVINRAKLGGIYHHCKWLQKVKDNRDSGNPPPDGQGNVHDQNNQTNKRR